MGDMLPMQGGEAEIFVYRINGVFAYGGRFGPANVTPYSTERCLQFLAENDF